MDAINWDQFRDIGEFFMRKKGDMLAGKPADDDFYGIEFQVGKGYDFFTTSAYEFLWQHGGDIWDETKQPNAHAVGVVNSKEAVASFEHLLSFAKYMPPVVKTGGLDIFKTDELFREGKVAINLEWIGFAESSINPATSKVADKVAFAQIPGLKTDKGVVKWSVIGGQPFVLMTWNTDIQNKEALDFCKWWLSKGTQVAFRQGRRPERAEIGLHRSVLSDIPAVEPHLGCQPRLAEGLLACARVLRAPDRAAGGVHQGHHRPAGRQGDVGQHRQLRGEASARRRPYQIIGTGNNDVAAHTRAAASALPFRSASRPDGKFLALPNLRRSPDRGAIQKARPLRVPTK